MEELWLRDGMKDVVWEHVPKQMHMQFECDMGPSSVLDQSKNTEQPESDERRRRRIESESLGEYQCAK